MCNKNCNSKVSPSCNVNYATCIVYEGALPENTTIQKSCGNITVQDVVEDLYNISYQIGGTYSNGQGLKLTGTEFSADFGTTYGKVMSGDWRPTWGDIVDAPNIPQEVNINSGEGIEVTGSYPNFIINAVGSDEESINGISINNIVVAPNNQNISNIPLANSSTLGVVRVGEGLDIDSGGTLRAVGTTYVAGNGLTLSGNTFSLPITVNGTGTYVKSVTQTINGISVNLGTPPDTNTTYTAGSGLSLSGNTFSNTSPNATHTGDVTGSTSLTISNGVVTNTKLANVPGLTLKGNSTSNPSTPSDLTVNQVKTMLSVGSKTIITSVFPFTLPLNGESQIALFAKLPNNSVEQNIIIPNGQFDGQQLHIEFNLYRNDSSAIARLSGSFINFIEGAEEDVVGNIRDANLRRVFAYWSSSNSAWIVKIIKMTE